MNKSSQRDQRHRRIEQTDGTVSHRGQHFGEPLDADDQPRHRTTERSATSAQ
ncbi:hypothetical protein Syun_014576 [Stephania yunnanensis]|uniref:Uncharacterized protein n=1 Tax=Stephania yunnanensis TaxID=152371 RepID=A0AAP0JJL6_9MAGN